MAQTIHGGAYENPDGSWHDANGKPISPARVQEAKALKAELEAVASPIAPFIPSEQVVTPEPEEGEEEPTGKRGRSKKA